MKQEEKKDLKCRKENNMKAKYYLARLIAGSLQYSDTYWTSYKKALEARSKQVNPCQWIIVVNPLLHNTTSTLKIKLEQVRQGQLLLKAYKILQELV